jgi:hypothetical protein
MTIYDEIIEAAEKNGMDWQTARDLHSALCKADTPATRFAAEMVMQAMDHYRQADKMMCRLAVLSSPDGNLDL